MVEENGPSAKDIAVFAREFKELVRVQEIVRKQLYEPGDDFNNIVEDTKTICTQFNKKYKDISFHIQKTSADFVFQFFLHAPSLKGVWDDVASKLPGVDSVGITQPNQAKAGDAQAQKIIESTQTTLCISYFYQDKGNFNVTLHWNEKEKKVLLIADPKDIAIEGNPAAQIASFYAMKNIADSSIDIYKDAAVIGAMNWADDDEMHEFTRSRDPRHEE